MDAAGNLLFAPCSAFATVIFVYRPTTFLILAAVAIIYLYLLYEHLFNMNLVERAARLPGKLPSKTEFLRTRVRHLVALIDDDCIICRGQVEAPVQVLPCNHIFCKNCFDLWLDTNQTRCPQCARMLFQTTNRLWERFAKVVVAHIYIGFPLALVNIALGPLSRFRICLDTVAAVLLFACITSISKTKQAYGTEWWRYWIRDEPVANDEEVWEQIYVNVVCVLMATIWLFYQALLFECWLGMPKYYLWNVLCAW